MNVYERYADLNRRIGHGEKISYGWRDGGPSSGDGSSGGGRILRCPKIGVYAGAGTSHSWLWFVEIFDRMGFHDLAFLDEYSFQRPLAEDLDVLAVSGGDTFAVARGLGPEGAKNLESFVRKGGLYIGSCAGAYLPLNSSKEYLNWFNFVDAKITNLSNVLPPSKLLPEKFSTSYGCSFIFHPVREEVRLKTNGIEPFMGVKELAAPLYGGPSMVAGPASEVLASYDAFTGKTLFLVDKETAREILLGRSAVIRKNMGEGWFYLFGPHFEHPRYAAANKLVADVMYWGQREVGGDLKREDNEETVLEGPVRKSFIRDVKRELSNSRIVAASMENSDVRWLIGSKVYEPEKIRVFIEAMWSRIRTLEKLDRVVMKQEAGEAVVEHGVRTTSLVRTLKNLVGEGAESVEPATELFDILHKLSTSFLDMYFRSVLSNELKIG